MIRVAKFKSGDYKGQTFHWFEAQGQQKMIVSIEGKHEQDEMTWLDAGKRRGTVKGEFDSIREFFEDNFNRTLKRINDDVYVADWDAALKDEENGTQNALWHNLNSLSESLLRKVYKNDDWYIVKRYIILDPETESYANHISDACQNSEGIPSWINLLTGECQYSLEQPGEEWYQFYCETRIRSTKNKEPYSCFGPGNKELSEKFVAWCKLNGSPVDNSTGDNPEPEPVGASEPPKGKRNRNGKPNPNIYE